MWPDVLSHASGNAKFVICNDFDRWHCSLVIIIFTRDKMAIRLRSLPLLSTPRSRPPTEGLLTDNCTTAMARSITPQPSHKAKFDSKLHFSRLWNKTAFVYVVHFITLPTYALEALMLKKKKTCNKHQYANSCHAQVGCYDMICALTSNLVSGILLRPYTGHGEADWPRGWPADARIHWKVSRWTQKANQQSLRSVLQNFDV